MKTESELLDYFAAAALDGLIRLRGPEVEGVGDGWGAGQPTWADGLTFARDVACDAYEIALAMLEARDRQASIRFAARCAK